MTFSLLSAMWGLRPMFVLSAVLVVAAPMQGPLMW